MYKILEKKILATDRYSFKIYAPEIAKSTLPGQFVILIVDEGGERIPLTICDSDPDEGTVYLVVEVIGLSTRKLGEKIDGDYISELVGPLGLPSKFIYEDVEKLRQKKLLLVGGGVGSAPLIPQAKWLKERGIEFDVLLGSRSKEFLVLEDRFSELTDNLYIVTDDGSYGYHGLIPTGLEKLVKERGKKYDLCIIIGPLVMMKFTAEMTKKLNIPSIVSMNPIMVDGTGMCGACRVTVGGETKFACVDGPEFDAHLVDFDEALRRQGLYKEIEIQKDHEYCQLVEGIING